MKNSLLGALLLLAAGSAQTVGAASPAPAPVPDPPSAEIRLDRQALRPRYREWMTPAGGVEVRQNPPALLWPAGEERRAHYRVELSDSPRFPVGGTLVSEQEWAVFTPHEPLAAGRWYWRVTTIAPGKAPVVSEVCDFVVTDSARRFATPTADRLVGRIAATPHHRLYVTREATDAFRERARRNPEAVALVEQARAKLGMGPVPVLPTRPRDTTGMTPFEKNAMVRFMWHKFGEVVTQPAVDFSLAYLLTGEVDFADAAVRHALHAAALPVDSDATSEDFNRSAIMYGLAVAYDTACDRMTPDERAKVLEAIRVRGEHFYRHYVRDFECHSMDNHVWQHTFRNFFFMAIATLGDLPEAEKWVRYGYEVWCGRFPILGGDDGGWHDGNSYFEANLVTFVYVPFVLGRLTGVDFFDLPWYEKLPGFLVYSFPKGSSATEFGDDYDKLRTPSAQYMGFADALARELSSPEARWYADRLIGDDPANLYKAKTFRLYRILTDKPVDAVRPQAPQRNTSRCYPDAGFSLMHTDPADCRDDLMAAFFALPFGATGHAHAAHNGFTISYGGRPLFGGTGYYSDFNDKHTLMHYRTRGHNTVLADGLAQVIGENGYGWLARWADTPALTYTLGDASHAYDTMRTPFWIDRMRKAGVEYTRENGFGDPGVERFRRHFLLLKPDIVVIYDELAAREPVVWTWLLHSRNGLTQLSERAVAASNHAATGRMDLFCDGALRTEVHDRFFYPAVNWKQRTGADGKPRIYRKQGHAEFSTVEKRAAQRFLAVFRITPDGAEPCALTCDDRGRITVGGWRIEAQLDASKPASLCVSDANGNEVLYNTPSSTVAGSTLVREQGACGRELVDQVPVSVR